MPLRSRKRSRKSQTSIRRYGRTTKRRRRRFVRTRRRRRYGRMLRRSSRLRAAFPRVKKVTLTWAQDFSISNATLPTYNPILCLNDPYRPGSTAGVSGGTGWDHQPRFWDQLTALYTKACVIGGVCTVRVISCQASGASAMANAVLIGAIDDDSEADIPSVTQAIEQRLYGAKFASCALNFPPTGIVNDPENNSVLNTSSSVAVPNRQPMMRIKFGTKKIFGIPKKENLLPIGTRAAPQFDHLPVVDSYPTPSGNPPGAGSEVVNDWNNYSAGKSGTSSTWNSPKNKILLKFAIKGHPANPIPELSTSPVMKANIRVTLHQTILFYDAPEFQQS